MQTFVFIVHIVMPQQNQQMKKIQFQMDHLLLLWNNTIILKIDQAEVLPEIQALEKNEKKILI